jgi:carbonic anhydrase
MFPLFPDPTAPTMHRPGAPDSGDALARLIAGNHRFAAGTPRHGHRITAAMAAASEPRPYAVVLACMDARVAVEAIFDQDFGEVCVVRSAGNVADRGVLASIELAVTTFGIDLVMVLGHTRCAAVAAAVTMGDRRLPGRHVRQLLEEIRAAGGGSMDQAIHGHVRRTVAGVAAALPAGGAAGAAGGAALPIRVVGAVYDVGTGRAAVLT